MEQTQTRVAPMGHPVDLVDSLNTGFMTQFRGQAQGSQRVQRKHPHLTYVPVCLLEPG